jgi:hypothetical protein
MKLSEIGVNTHIHTPYSFSAFSSMDQIFQMTGEENIKVLGINDFYTDEGYNNFKDLAGKYGVYPLFCMEYIGLLKDKQQQNIRVNDPNNPGRTYLCGKAFSYPFNLGEEYSEKLNMVILESQAQVMAMVEKANQYFASFGLSIFLDFDQIKTNFAHNLVRERHIARAIRVMVFQENKDERERKKILNLILNTDIDGKILNEEAALENVIRSRLLKKGGMAFVAETESTFLPVTDLVNLILDGKGIPCYPVLLDDPDGNFTEFESDWELLYQNLVALGIYAIELIPGRNDFRILKKFVNFFNRRNFIVTFGTEHNTPEMIPLTVKCRHNQPLDDEVKNICFNGACVLAAHQQLMAEGKEGYIDSFGKAKSDRISEFVSLGKVVLQDFLTY